MALHQVFDNNSNVIEETFDATWDAANRRAAILAELAALDCCVPRSVEEIHAALHETLELGLAQENLDRIARKQALREELAGLPA
jgi:hypothetical protein